MRSRLLSTLGLWVGVSCGGPGPSSPPVHVEPAPLEAVALPTATATTDPTSSLSEVPPTLPPDVIPGQLSSVPIRGYRAATVVHGRAETTLAMIYLHGICGQVSRIADWAEAASDFVTTIAPTGNKPCPESSSRFSWNQDIELIHQQLDWALETVAQQRNGRLDTAQVLVFGYSQGASRAERLVERYPKHYRWVILGGPPRSPIFERVHEALGLALLVGTEEHRDELADLASEFTTRGLRTRFDQFDGVGHGFFGPSSPDVMRRTLTWLDLRASGPAN